MVGGPSEILSEKFQEILKLMFCGKTALDNASSTIIKSKGLNTDPCQVYTQIYCKPLTFRAIYYINSL